VDHHSSQKGKQDRKRHYDDRGDDQHEKANYSSHTTDKFMNNSSAHMSGGCKKCGCDVIHLDGRCDVYKSTGIRDSNVGS
jgi:hypothetical protein